MTSRAIARPFILLLAAITAQSAAAQTAQNIRPTADTPSEATGYVTDSVCASKSQRIDVKTSTGTVHLRTPISGVMPIDDSPEVPAGFNPCKSLKGQRVRVQYTAERDGVGTITSLRILPMGEVNSAEGPIAQLAPPAAPASGSSAPSPLVPDALMTAEGKVTDVTCNGNDLIVKIATDKRQFTLHARNYTRLTFDDDRRSFVDQDFPACTDLKGRVASIDFIVVEGKPYDGDMRHVEILR